MTDSLVTPRKTPCASCPYRRDVPSGVWAASEYNKLASYDGTTSEQLAKGALGVFVCHQGNEDEICAGWAGTHDMDHNLAIRLDSGVDREAVRAYATDVPLFASGAEAAEHGKREIEHPAPEAVAITEKVTRVRALRGKPVRRS